MENIDFEKKSNELFDERNCRRKKFPLIFFNIVVSALMCVATFYFFIIHYGYTVNPNLMVFGVLTIAFGMINIIGIKISPAFFLPEPRSEERQNTRNRKEDVSEFMESSVVSLLIGIIIVIVVKWYS